MGMFDSREGGGFMIKKNVWKKIGLSIVPVAIASAMLLSNVHAVGWIDTERNDCVIQIDIRETGNMELNILPVSVQLYKIADVSAVGNYTVIDELKGGLNFDEFNSDTTDPDSIDNAYWEAKTEIAKNLIDEKKLSPTAVCKVENGIGRAEDLTVGLYLVDAQSTMSAQYGYNFKPYLISLPNNYYGTDNASKDEWVYNLELSLKAERVDRYGDLKIVKELDTYNETTKGATFVFQIEAVKTDVDSNKDHVVYSDVVAVSFEKPGVESVIIEDIPAGAKVTVTEIYAGSNYKLESAESLNVTIVADDDTDTDDETQVVTFKNTSDGSLEGGCCIVNTYTYDSEGSKWTNNQNPEWEKTINHHVTEEQQTPQ